MPPPMTRPVSARSVLIAAWVSSVPLRRFSQKATATALGAGSSAGRQPARCGQATSQTSTRAIGSAQDASSEAVAAPALRTRDPARHGQDAFLAAGRISLAIVSPNGPVLTANARPLRRMRQRQQREDELGEAIGFLEVRIAGEDERVDADRHVLLHARRHRLRVADQRGSGAAAHQPDARPQVGADLELVAPAAMQRRHAPLPDRIHAREDALRLGDRLVVEMADQPVGRRPCLFRRLAHDDVQPDAEAELAAPWRPAAALTVSIFSATCAGGSPQVRYLSTVLGRDVDPGLGRAAEIERRMRRLHRREEQPPAFDADVLARRSRPSRRRAARL